MRETKQRKKVKDILFKIFAIILITFFTGIENALIIFLILMVFYLVYEVIWNNIRWGQFSRESCIMGDGITFNQSNHKKREEDSIKL
ncbi:hypothetical protein [Flavobacterium sp.]|uniref:hypothetical protein n=1 Tax=Flavobacterium sp. TaxID=239 RepID=UPI003D10EB0E